MNFKPVRFRVVIALPPVETKSKGGIITVTDDRSDSYQRASEEGKIVALGPNAFEDFSEPKPKVGDKVQITKYCGVDKKDEESGVVYRTINDTDILNIIED